MAFHWIATEAAALERRLEAVPRFATTIPMVDVAIPASRALSLADSTVMRSKRMLRRQLREFRRTTASAARNSISLRRVQRRLNALRYRFNALLGTVDAFSDCLTQRAEHSVGVLLRGLDVLAQDGIKVRLASFRPPPIVCYLDRGIGGAIRRAFTFLPGGERNAIALVKLPRERLSGVGLASLLHEVAHQGVADLGLLRPYRGAVHRLVRTGDLTPSTAVWWSSKLNELLPDAWACAKLGITASLGLFGVLSNLSRFVFHDDPNDPHPMPYVRALFSVAFGNAIFPHPIWSSLATLWRTLNPLDDTAPQAALATIVRSIPLIAHTIASERLNELGGMNFPEAVAERRAHPAHLVDWRATTLGGLRRAPASLSPCLTLASIGLARQLGTLEPGEEHVLLEGALRGWAEQTVPNFMES